MVKPRNGVSNEVYSALDKIGAPSVGPLIAQLADYPDACELCDALAKIGSPGVEPLIAALQSPDSQVRRRAAAALEQIQDVRAVEPLIAALKDVDPKVREIAAESLGRFNEAQKVCGLQR